MSVQTRRWAADKRAQLILGMSPCDQVGQGLSRGGEKSKSWWRAGGWPTATPPRLAAHKLGGQGGSAVWARGSPESTRREVHWHVHCTGLLQVRSRAIRTWMVTARVQCSGLRHFALEISVNLAAVRAQGCQGAAFGGCPMPRMALTTAGFRKIELTSMMRWRTRQSLHVRPRHKLS